MQPAGGPSRRVEEVNMSTAGARHAGPVVVHHRGGAFSSQQWAALKEFASIVEHGMTCHPGGVGDMLRVLHSDVAMVHSALAAGLEELGRASELTGTDETGDRIFHGGHKQFAGAWPFQPDEPHACNSQPDKTPE